MEGCQRHNPQIPLHGSGRRAGTADRCAAGKMRPVKYQRTLDPREGTSARRHTNLHKQLDRRSGSCGASSSSPGHSALLLRHGRRQVDGVVPLRRDALLSLPPHRGFPPRGRSRPGLFFSFFFGKCEGGVKVKQLSCFLQLFKRRGCTVCVAEKSVALLGSSEPITVCRRQREVGCWWVGI